LLTGHRMQTQTRKHARARTHKSI